MLQGYKRSAVILADALGWLNWANDEVVENAIGGSRFSIQGVAKRGVDIAVSLLAILMEVPVFLFLAAAIKFTSKGPIFERSLRIGIGGRAYELLTFRVPSTPNGSISSIGQFLTKSDLVYLPNLINVFRGDMSLVGPPSFPVAYLNPAALDQHHLSWLRLRSRVKPGIASLWRVKSRDLSFDDLVRYDIEYVQNWSILSDIQMLIGSPRLVIPRNADEDAIAAFDQWRFREA